MYVCMYVCMYAMICRHILERLAVKRSEVAYMHTLYTHVLYVYGWANLRYEYLSFESKCLSVAYYLCIVCMYVCIWI